MRRHLFCLIVILVFAAAGGIRAEEVEVNWTYSGSQIDTRVDVNFDGTTANEVHVWAKGAPGKASINGMFEIVVLGPTDECPYPLAGTQFLYSTYVARFENGDLLFARATTADGGCIDPVTGTSTAVLHYNVVGGTGKYQGATGSYDDTATFIFLFQGTDPLNPVPFAALFGHAEGYIHTTDE